MVVVMTRDHLYIKGVLPFSEPPMSLCNIKMVPYEVFPKLRRYDSRPYTNTFTNWAASKCPAALFC